eukprot:1364096-Pyramimonas_sp.AAC.1
MASDRWKTGRKADVTRDHLLDTLLHYDCFGRVGSGSPFWDRDARFALEHLRSHRWPSRQGTNCASNRTAVDDGFGANVY